MRLFGCQGSNACFIVHVLEEAAEQEARRVRDHAKASLLPKSESKAIYDGFNGIGFNHFYQQVVIAKRYKGLKRTLNEVQCKGDLESQELGILTRQSIAEMQSLSKAIPTNSSEQFLATTWAYPMLPISAMEPLCPAAVPIDDETPSGEVIPVALV